MATWTYNDPQDSDTAFPNVAGEVRDTKTLVRERLDTILTAGVAPVPPTTLVNTNTQITDGRFLPGAGVTGCGWHRIFQRCISRS